MPTARQREAQRFLGAGLADRAGDRDDLCLASGRAPRAPSVSSAVEHIGDDEQRRRQPAERMAACLRPPPASRRRPCSAAATKSWPSRHSPLMAKKASPGCRLRLSIEMPRYAVRQRARARRAAHRPATSASTVQSGHAHAAAPRSAAAHRLVVAERQSRGRRRSGRSRGPCRRPAARRRPAASATAVADRLARGRRSRSRRARRPGWRRGSSPASSLRGLSSVTMTTVGEPRRDLAHHRALAAVAVAAAAEHDDERGRCVNGRSASQHVRQRVGLVRVVDIDRRAVRGLPTRSSRPGRP